MVNRGEKKLAQKNIQVTARGKISGIFLEKNSFILTEHLQLCYYF